MMKNVYRPKDKRMLAENKKRGVLISMLFVEGRGEEKCLII